MLQVESVLQLPAPRQRVWQALTDFPRYPEWNANVRLRGAAGPEGHLDCSFGMFPGSRKIWTSATVTRWEPPRTFAWSLRVGALLSFEETYTVAVQRGATSVRHTLGCGGLLVKLAGRLMRKRLNLLLLASDEGLRRHLTAQVRAPARKSARSGAAPRVRSRSSSSRARR